MSVEAGAVGGLEETEAAYRCALEGKVDSITEELAYLRAEESLLIAERRRIEGVLAALAGELPVVPTVEAKRAPLVKPGKRASLTDQELVNLIASVGGLIHAEYLAGRYYSTEGSAFARLHRAAQAGVVVATVDERGKRAFGLPGQVAPAVKTPRGSKRAAVLRAAVAGPVSRYTPVEGLSPEDVSATISGAVAGGLLVKTGVDGSGHTRYELTPAGSEWLVR